MRKPDFDNLLAVLNRKVPSRPTLFEFFMNDNAYSALTGARSPEDKDAYNLFLAEAYANAGYDYVVLLGSGFDFLKEEQKSEKTISLNGSHMITDWESFEKYKWNNPEDFDYSWLKSFGDKLVSGQKVIIMAPKGVLESVIGIVGYDNLCYMIYEEPKLAKEIFKNVGESLIKYYELCIAYDCVGAVFSNDDWGFNTQTFFNRETFEEYLYPWHRKIVNLIHSEHKPALLHSCGNLKNVMDDIIFDIKYDAKHSYEDNIIPVEEAYDTWGKDIAILGGIDVNFLITSDEKTITERCEKMLSKAKKGYALGSGNSIPYYLPNEKYFAMLRTVNKELVTY